MKRIPLVIDVDTGTDDAICLICALLNQMMLDIRFVSTVCGNVSLEKTSKNTLNLLRFLGSGILVAKGASKPLKQELHCAVSHGESGLGDIVLPVADPVFLERNAWDALYDEAVAQKGNLQLLAVGPLTNVAMAIEKYPEIKTLINRITIMGGSLLGGNMTMASEFNIFNDPEAAQIVFESGIPLTMIGLDVTLKPKLPMRVVNAIRKIDTPHAQVTKQIIDFMIRRKSEIGGDAPNFHDVIALMAVIAPSILTYRPYYMTVETEGKVTRGMTVADFLCVSGREPNVNVAIDIDVRRFWRWFLDNFERGADK